MRDDVVSPLHDRFDSDASCWSTKPDASGDCCCHRHRSPSFPTLISRCCCCDRCYCSCRSWSRLEKTNPTDRLVESAWTWEARSTSPADPAGSGVRVSLPFDSSSVYCKSLCYLQFSEDCMILAHGRVQMISFPMLLKVSRQAVTQ